MDYISSLKQGWVGKGLLLGVAALALFGSGAVISRAAWSEDKAPPAVLTFGDGGLITAPKSGMATSEPGAAGTPSFRTAPGRPSLDSEDSSQLIAPDHWGYCPAPAPSIFANGVIDPRLAGFNARMLGAGFTLSHFSIRAEGPCGDDGRATSGTLVVDTGWIHAETGLDLWMSQRVSETPVASVRYPDSATVYDGGYAFNAYVNAYRIMPADKPLIAEDAPATRGDTRLAGYGPDPRAEAVLDAALAQIAPGVKAQCYYRQVQGTWADLAALGIGDPRSAIPAGYSESHLYVATFAAPASECGSSLPSPVGGGNFNASFTNASGDSIQVHAYVMPEAQENYPGYLDDWGASWASNGISFGVWGGKATGGLGTDVILAIAKAMDPSFSQTCMVLPQPLTEAELLARGIRSPEAPDGFTLSSFEGRTNGVAPDCKKPDPNFRTEHSGNWMFEGPDGVIEVFAARYENATSTREGGISDHGFKWMDGKGGVYYIQGRGTGPSGLIDLEVLVAVALSMDPDFDIEALQGGPDMAGGGSSGSTGSATLPKPEPATR
jgi:hypothetical protein